MMATTLVSTEVVEEEVQEEATTQGVETTTLIATINIIREKGLDTLHPFMPRISMKRRVNLLLRIMILHMAEMLTLSAVTESQKHSIQKCGKCFLSEFL